jgi:hypothetical protein
MLSRLLSPEGLAVRRERPLSSHKHRPLFFAFDGPGVSGLLVYEKRCLYLYPNGVHEVRMNELDEEDAQQRSCPPFGK